MMYVTGYYSYLSTRINKMQPACNTIYFKGKDKTIPKQYWIDPEGSKRLRLPD